MSKQGVSAADSEINKLFPPEKLALIETYMLPLNAELYKSASRERAGSYNRIGDAAWVLMIGDKALVGKEKKRILEILQNSFQITPNPNDPAELVHALANYLRTKCGYALLK